MIDGLDIDVSISEPEWTTALADPAALCGVAARAAVATAHPEQLEAEASILLTDDAQVRDLNREYRGKDKPTNVLSFANIDRPDSFAAAPVLLGDVVIAFGVTSIEAKNEGKTLADHLTHLVIHGVLHLLGYDHQKEDEAGRMEALEIRALAGLGVADPYHNAIEQTGP